MEKGSPLEKYKGKVRARNWAEFANKVMQSQELTPSLHKPSPTNFSPSEPDVVVTYTGKTGRPVEVAKACRPLSAIRLAGPGSRRNDVKLSYYHGNPGPESEKTFSLAQLELLERIGALVKSDTPYYPPSIEEVEYFVRGEPDLLYDQHYSAPTALDKSSENVGMRQTVKDFGLSAYRSSLHLTSREECVVLLDWLGKMQARYANDRQLRDHRDRGLRNLELILSFCIGETVRMSKVECADRAEVLLQAWRSAVGLIKSLEGHMLDLQRKTIRMWKEKFDAVKEQMENALSAEQSAHKDLAERIRRLEAEARVKDVRLHAVEEDAESYRGRAEALSGVLDHISARGISETKERNKRQKRMMAKTFRELRKDRLASTQRAYDNTMNEEEEDTDSLQNPRLQNSNIREPYNVGADAASRICPIPEAKKTNTTAAAQTEDSHREAGVNTESPADVTVGPRSAEPVAVVEDTISAPPDQDSKIAKADPTSNASAAPEDVAVGAKDPDQPLVEAEKVPALDQTSNHSLDEAIDAKSEDYRQLLTTIMEKSGPTLRNQIHQSTIRLFKGAPLSELVAAVSASCADVSSQNVEESSPTAEMLPAQRKQPMPSSFSKAVRDGESLASPRVGAEETPRGTEPDASPNAAALEDPQSELPKRLMAAMSMMSDKISALGTDEYGEWLLDITKDSDLVRKITQNGHLLTLLLRNLYKKKGEPAESDVRLYDMQTQTETVFTADTLKQTVRIHGGHLVTDCAIQAALDEPVPTIPHTPMTGRNARQPYVYNEKRQLQSSAFTVAQPFNIGGRSGLALGTSDATHPGQVFLATFVERVERRDARYLNVVPMTLRQLVKAVHAVYGEKLASGKESVSARVEPLSDFIYDSYINKYGLLNVAERKLKELLLAVALNRSRVHEVELFARFMGLSHILYTADDLYFVFCLAQQLLLTYSPCTIRHHNRVASTAYVKQKAATAAFELARQATREELLETVEGMLSGKLSPEAMADVKARIGEAGKIDIDVIYTMLVEKYREAKENIRLQLIKQKVIQEGQDRCDYHEYTKIVSRFEPKEGENWVRLFDKYATLCADEETRKLISLEAVVSHVFRNGIALQAKPQLKSISTNM